MSRWIPRTLSALLLGVSLPAAGAQEVIPLPKTPPVAAPPAALPPAEKRPPLAAPAASEDKPEAGAAEAAEAKPEDASKVVKLDSFRKK